MPTNGRQDRIAVLSTEIRDATSLTDLRVRLGSDSIHEAYFEAKEIWKSAVGRQQAQREERTGLPGSHVRIGAQDVHVHGITHADTTEERSFLREHVSRFLDGDAAVYCEQGIRPLYFDDIDAVCEMDDYLWAMDRCERLDTESRLERLPEHGIEGLRDDVAGFASQFRKATFSLIDSASSMYSDRFEAVLGDIAASFVTDHAELATGQSYEAFSLSRAASRNPERLVELQQYYERTFLPQPLEREWIRRHDRELEIVSHARNERMADYVIYHSDDTEEIHLIVGAAHQPGVGYYLGQYRDGRELPDSFEPF